MLSSGKPRYGRQGAERPVSASYGQFWRGVAGKVGYVPLRSVGAC